MSDTSTTLTQSDAGATCAILMGTTVVVLCRVRQGLEEARSATSSPPVLRAWLAVQQGWHIPFYLQGAPKHCTLHLPCTLSCRYTPLNCTNPAGSTGTRRGRWLPAVGVGAPELCVSERADRPALCKLQGTRVKQMPVPSSMVTFSDDLASLSAVPRVFVATFCVIILQCCCCTSQR